MKSILKCPKCNNKNLIIYEEYLASKSFFQCNGEIDISIANGEYGEIVKMTALCSHCKHHWTIKGIVICNKLNNRV